MTLSHDRKDITETCDRILLLARGKLLFDGSLKGFERRFASLSFKFIGPFSQQMMVPQQLLQASRYPLAVYPNWPKNLLLVVIPFGTFQYLPGRV